MQFLDFEQASFSLVEIDNGEPGKESDSLSRVSGWNRADPILRPCFVTQDIYIHWFIDQRWEYRHVWRRVQVASRQTRPFERKRLRGVTGEFAVNFKQSFACVRASPRKALGRTLASFSEMSTRFSQLVTNLLTCSFDRFRLIVLALELFQAQRQSKLLSAKIRQRACKKCPHTAVASFTVILFMKRRSGLVNSLSLGEH